MAAARQEPWSLQRLLLPAAVLLPLAIQGMGAWTAWNSTWEQARAEVAHTADASAEYARSVLELHRNHAARANQLLRGLSDEEIRAREPELHHQLKNLVAFDGVGNAFRLYVFDRNGSVLVNTDTVPSPPDSHADRDFMRRLRGIDPPPLVVGEVMRGRSDGRYYFPLSLRRENTGNGLPPGSFEGAVNVSIAPETLGEALFRLHGGEGDVLALVRADGSVLARTRPIDTPPPWRKPAQTEILSLMQAGEPSFLRDGPSSVDGVSRLEVYRRVEGWPVYAIAARDRDTIVARWRSRAAGLLMLGMPATLALALLALMVRRAYRAAETARHGLEQRVQERTAELARRTAELASSENRLRLALEAANLGIFEVDFRTGLAERSPRTLAIFGAGPEDLVGPFPAWHDRIHPEDRARVAAERDAVKTGSKDRYAMEYRYQRPDGRWIWVETRAQVVERDVDGRPLRITGAVQDVTDRREAEERRALLAREVDHRAKNALAVVQAALRLTSRQDPHAYAAAVEGRVAALARAHTLLALERWAGAELAKLLEGELAAFLSADACANEPQAELLGPVLHIAPSAAQSLSLAFHEMATNAVKYGALSVPGGRLRVTWSEDEMAGLLHLVWRERGGPAVTAPPTRRGFGSRLVAATVRDQLGGGLVQEWDEGGLTIEMRIPLARVRAENKEAEPAVPAL